MQLKRRTLVGMFMGLFAVPFVPLVSPIETNASVMTGQLLRTWRQVTKGRGAGQYPKVFELGPRSFQMYKNELTPAMRFVGGPETRDKPKVPALKFKSSRVVLNPLNDDTYITVIM